jgi:hypothetical protein
MSRTSPPRIKALWLLAFGLVLLAGAAMLRRSTSRAKVVHDPNEARGGGSEAITERQPVLQAPPADVMGSVRLEFRSKRNESYGLVWRDLAGRIERVGWIKIVAHPSAHTPSKSAVVEGLTAGMKRLTVHSGAGFLVHETAVSIVAGQRADLLVDIMAEEDRPVHMVRGRVLDSRGVPVCGAKVYCWLRDTTPAIAYPAGATVLRYDIAGAGVLRDCGDEKPSDPYSAEAYAALFRPKAVPSPLVPAGSVVFADGAIYRYAYSGPLGMFSFRVNDARDVYVKVRRGEVCVSAAVRPDEEASIRLPVEIEELSFESAYEMAMKAILEQDPAKLAEAKGLLRRKGAEADAAMFRRVEAATRALEEAAATPFDFHDRDLKRRLSRTRHAGDVAYEIADLLSVASFPSQPTIEPRE